MTLFFGVIWLFYCFATVSNQSNDPTANLPIQSWAEQFGEELWKLGEFITNSKEIEQAYEQATLEPLNGFDLVKKMAEDVRNMAAAKVASVQRILDVAQESSHGHSGKPNKTFSYKDAKYTTTWSPGKELCLNPHFFNTKVSPNFSTVHVPTNVYNGTPEVIKAIEWSEILDRYFLHNYAQDPSMSWQYFASSTGFMRLYPGVQWNDGDEDQVDLYDSRMKGWYVDAASNPKDVVILIDSSGSMMGEKRQIARHTVNTILEMLGPNDFVNVFRFTDGCVETVVPCFGNNVLAQASMPAIRELKRGVENMGIATARANFTVAIEHAFKVLKTQKESHTASLCNQAIMLITDGVPENFKEIFEEHNWNRTEVDPVTGNGGFPVRVFTFLIGRDGPDLRETRWIACANQGYFVQLNTMQEVRDQVLQYTNVLARPLVLSKARQVTWTSIYAHITDQKVMDYRWEKQLNEKQYVYTNEYRKDAEKYLSGKEQLFRMRGRRLMELDQNSGMNDHEYKFITTVSMPAYEKIINKTYTQSVLLNDDWTEITYETKLTNLLGVAATDIPVDEFTRLMKPYLLGANNYGFVVNNNGYLITHPELRPIFRGILKPGYGSVDFVEVELFDDHSTNSRNFSFPILELRDLIINQSTDYRTHKVKFARDNLRRLATGERHYYIHGIKDTPFSISLAFSKKEIHRVVAPDMENIGTQVKSLFTGNWRIHPKWFYCKYDYRNKYHPFKNANDELKHFLDLRWGFKDFKYEPTECADDEKDQPFNSSAPDKLDILNYRCDKVLLNALFYDANVTKPFFDENTTNAYKNSKDKKNVLQQRFGISNVFISTHSGLLRWMDLTPNATYNSSRFGNVSNKAVDEIWYKRAVDQYYVDPASFVFSVPLMDVNFDGSTTDDESFSESKNVITASHAIFLKREEMESPVAVAGFQFNQSAMRSLFNNISQKCSGAECDWNRMTYYILDNNAYVVVSNCSQYSRKLFGSVHPRVMNALVRGKVYRRVQMFDYQGVCFHNHKFKTNDASNIQISSMMRSLATMFVKIIMGTILNLPSYWTSFGSFPRYVFPLSPCERYATNESAFEEELWNKFEKVPTEKGKLPKYKALKHLCVINRTRPQTCDRKFVLYELEPPQAQAQAYQTFGQGSSDDAYFKVERIPYTNLVLVVVSLDEPRMMEAAMEMTAETSPKEVEYPFTHTIPDECRSPVQTEHPKLPPPPNVCHKVGNPYSRQRPRFCINHHKEEKEINICGNSAAKRRIFISVIIPCLIRFAY